MLVLAHRGYHSSSPENTLAAFAEAIKMGVDGIETDVRLSADEKLVVVHDRVVRGKRAVANLTHRELEAAVGHPVALLQEVLDAFPAVLWNVEIKTATVWPYAAPVLARYSKTRRLLVSSFRHDVVARCADEIDVDCALLIAHRPLVATDMIGASASRTRIRSVVWDYNIIDEASLGAIVAAGWSNFVYGPVTRAEHDHCRGLGLAGVITDYPEHLLKNV